MEPNLHTDADKYQAGMGSWSKTLAPLFIEFIDGVKEGDRVLDVGCGTGSLTFTIADTTKASTVVGIDPSVGYVEYARAQNSHPHVAFEIGDAQNLLYDDGYFDCCASSLPVCLGCTHGSKRNEARHKKGRKCCNVCMGQQWRHGVIGKILGCRRCS
jgi:SAM-dependent methyltransferase